MLTGLHHWCGPGAGRCHRLSIVSIPDPRKLDGEIDEHGFTGQEE
jgi:hypothetical protein